MKNLINKVVEVKKLHDEKPDVTYEPKVTTSNTPDNLTPRMKTKLNKIETLSLTKTKPITSADDSAIHHNKHKQDTFGLKKDITTSNHVEDVTINPLSYLQKDGSINFSKLLIDEVLAADKLLIEAAKLTYDIAGYIFVFIILFFNNLTQ